MPWPSPERLKELSGRCILRWRWGQTHHQHSTHAATTDCERSMQPIAHRLRLNPSSSKYIHYQANSIFQSLNLISCWMPGVQALIHPSPPSQDLSSHLQDVQVVPKYKLIKSLRHVFQVLTWMNLMMAACWLHSCMVGEEVRYPILNCHLNDQCNSEISCCDCLQDPHSG